MKTNFYLIMVIFCTASISVAYSQTPSASDLVDTVAPSIDNFLKAWDEAFNSKPISKAITDCLRIIKIAQTNFDPLYRSYPRPSLNVFLPGDSFIIPGTRPSEIKDPAVRARYTAAIEHNIELSEKLNYQILLDQRLDLWKYAFTHSLLETLSPEEKALVKTQAETILGKVNAEWIPQK